MKKLSKAVQAVLDNLPSVVQLKVYRCGSDGTANGHCVVVDEVQDFRLDQPGGWLCVAHGGYGNYAMHYGRGTSAEVAVRNCYQAGGRFGKKADMVLQWQPAVAWLEHAKLWPERAAECDAPTINGHWGSPYPWTAWQPSSKLG